MLPASVIRAAGWLALLGLATAGGVLLTGQLARHTSVLPGERGCRALADRNERTSCYAKALASAIDDASPARLTRSLGAIDDDAASMPALEGVCHQAMHVAGRAAGERAARRDTVPTFPAAASTRVCTAGYVHGVAEGYLQRSPSANVAHVFPQLCHEEAARAGCAHGIGHAVLRAFGDAAPPPRSVERARSRCDELPSAHVMDCVNGVYMELATRDQVRLEKLVTMCAGAPGADARSSCFSYVPLRAASAELPQRQVLDLCARQELLSAAACTESLGRELGPEQVGECGNTATAALMRSCVRGAMELQLTTGSIDVDDARRACSDASAAVAATCNAVVERIVRID